MVRSVSKNRLVNTIFQYLAGQYDRLDRWVTGRAGQAWRRRAIELLRVEKPARVLEGCAGTGILTSMLAETLGPQSYLVAMDHTPAMLNQAKQRLRGANLHRRVEFRTENVEVMQFPDEFFDGAIMAFGMRFVSDIRIVLKEFHRVLNPGGSLVILELNTPASFFPRAVVNAWREYGFPLWAEFGLRVPKQLVHLLHDSLRYYPDPAKFARMLIRAGFTEVTYQTLRWGTATLHRAVKRGAPQEMTFAQEQAFVEG